MDFGPREHKQLRSMAHLKPRPSSFGTVACLQVLPSAELVALMEAYFGINVRAHGLKFVVLSSEGTSYPNSDGFALTASSLSKDPSACI